MHEDHEATGLTIPHMTNRFRWLVIVCGLMVFIWLGLEDNALVPVIVLSLATVCLAVFMWLVNNLGGQVIRWPALLGLGVLSGAAIGAGTSVFTAFLMFFKNARHSHIFPDFPIGMLIGMLERAPMWAIAGALIGLSIAFVWRAVR